LTLSTPPLQDRIVDLRNAVAGRVIDPGHPDYDAARAVMYGGIDRRPAAVVKVANVEDIRAVLAVVRETGAELAIRSGGHSAKGDSTTDGGIVIDLRDMSRIDIDPATKTAWAETGLTASDVSAKAAEHGFAIGFGDTGSVGIGGITTGGGIGYLVRKYGMTIDNVLAADIVTADGELLRADATNNPDLFWAIRGAGANFGVVTRFQFQLADLPEIVGGMLYLPATAETVERFVTLADEAPEELSTIANVMPCPPMPFVDAAWHGKLVIFGLMCYAGPADAGAAALQPFRDLAKLGGLDAPIGDLVKPMTYPEMFPPEDPDYHPTAVSLNMLLDRVDRETAATMLRSLEASDAPMRAAQIRVMGGAMARVAPDATAFAHRTSPIMLNIAVFYDGEDDKSRRETWMHEFANAVRQSDDGAYVNFVGDEGEARIHAAYPGATYDRLAELKRRYDPENVFRLNQNIRPA
jgi:FAD/FMN-containing dehydrogenase